MVRHPEVRCFSSGACSIPWRSGSIAEGLLYTKEELEQLKRESPHAKEDEKDKLLK
jgi:hypothetical protein